MNWGSIPSKEQRFFFLQSSQNRWGHQGPCSWDTATFCVALTFRRRIFFILAHPVYKIQEPNTIELWNKLHFEEEKAESVYHA